MLIGQMMGLKMMPILHSDNSAAVKLVYNPDSTKGPNRSKLRHFYVRELVARNKTEVRQISTDDQLVDLLIKVLQGSKLS